MALHGLTAPLTRAQIYTAQGVRDLVVVAGSSDKLYAIDADTGKIFWQKTLAKEGARQRTPSWLCPNALTATPVLGPARQMAPGQALYVLASDGGLARFNLISGEDLMPATKFLPAFSKMWSLNAVNGMLYSTTSQGCNGAASGVYAMDLSSADRESSYFRDGSTRIGRVGSRRRRGHQRWPGGFETGDGPYDPSKNLSDSVIALSAERSEAGGLLHAVESRLDHQEGPGYGRRQPGGGTVDWGADRGQRQGRRDLSAVRFEIAGRRRSSHAPVSQSAAGER